MVGLTGKGFQNDLQENLEQMDPRFLVSKFCSGIPLIVLTVEKWRLKVDPRFCRPERDQALRSICRRQVEKSRLIWQEGPLRAQWAQV
jgi:hypothetical protein